MSDAQILRIRDVTALTRISRSRVYEYMSREIDPFPRPLKLGDRAVGWRKIEVEEWLAARERAGSTQV